MGTYQFEMWNHQFVVDVESGNFFEVDKVAAKAINCLENFSKDQAIAILSKDYAKKDIDTTLTNLEELIAEGMLFSSPGQSCDHPKRRITDVTLNIVNDCNLNCRYCWNERGSYGTAPQNVQRMDKQVMTRAVDLLLKESGGANDLVVDFYGGEPLLNFDLIKETVETCKTITKEKGITFRFLLATNGTLMDKEKGEYLIKNGVDVAVSLDGDKAIQDKQRPFLNDSGSFDTIMSNLNSLNKDYRRRIVGRATFTPYSPNLIQTFEFLRHLDFDRIELCESEKAGYGLDANNEFFFSGKKGISDLKVLYNELARFYTNEIIAGTLTYDNTYFNRFFKQLSRLYHIHSIVGSCSAGFTLMAVDMDGRIYPCTAFVGIPEFSIGDVDLGIEDQKLNAFLVDKEKGDHGYGCNSCWAKKLCKGCGSCYNLNYFANNKVNQPDAYHCELFRYKTKLMIAMIAEIAEKNSDRLEDVLVPEYYETRGKQAAFV